MKKISSLILLFSIVTIFNWSCDIDKEQSQSSKGLYYFTNLDQYYGFIEPYSIIKSKIAHSGEYVSKTDSGSIYSFAFKRKKNDISEYKLLTSEVSCFVYSEKPNPDCSLVCAVDTGGLAPIYFASNKLSNDLTESKEWKKVTATFNFANDFPPNSIVSIFLMNQNNSVVYLDDLAVQFTDLK